jgi:small subunit ribosomal protein S16
VATIIRLTRKGKHKKPFYRIVATDSRNPRDGRFLEILGTYDPLADPGAIRIDEAKALKWIQEGAQVSDTVKSLFKKTGIYKQAEALKKI